MPWDLPGGGGELGGFGIDQYVTCEICGATHTGFKANECGLAKASSFSAIRTKHKESLDRCCHRGNPAQQHQSLLKNRDYLSTYTDQKTRTCKNSQISLEHMHTLN